MKSLLALAAIAATAITPARALTAGTHAIQLTSSTDAAGFAAHAPLVNDTTHWVVVGGGDQSGVLPDTTAVSVTAVPEPETHALMLAGPAAVGMPARRRA